MTLDIPSNVAEFEQLLTLVRAALEPSAFAVALGAWSEPLARTIRRSGTRSERAKNKPIAVMGGKYLIPLSKAHREASELTEEARGPRARQIALAQRHDRQIVENHRDAMPVAQLADQPQRRIPVRREAPGQHGAQVVVIRIQALEPRCLLGTQQLRLGRLGQRQEVMRVSPAHGIGLPACFQPLQGVLAQGFQHTEARLARAMLTYEFGSAFASREAPRFTADVVSALPREQGGLEWVLDSVVVGQ